jgi:hypothetical protein
VLIVSIDDPRPPGGGRTEAGLKVAVIPAGTLLAVNVTDELNVPTDWTPIFKVVLFPTITDLSMGDGTM